MARNTLEALEAEPCDVICVPAGSCATMMRVFWPELFHVTGDEEGRRRAERLAPKIKEFSELVAGRLDARATGTVAYHHSCHMLRELGIREEPLALLEAAGCRIATWDADERCCGFGGLFSVKQPETSVAMADDKIDALPEEAEVLVSCDQSCLLHLAGRLRRRGSSLAVKHLAEILDDD